VFRFLLEKASHFFPFHLYGGAVLAIPENFPWVPKSLAAYIRTVYEYSHLYICAEFCWNSYAGHHYVFPNLL
jgi:hypothetical protein